MRRILCFAFMTALVCSAAFGQTAPADSAAYIGKTIVEVGLLSEGRPVEDPAAAALIETQVGEPLSMASVRESITHLFGLGRFQDVRVDATDAPGGVRLHYDLIPLHSVQEVNFLAVSADTASPASGSKALGVDEGLLRRTMTNRFGASPPVGRAPEVARTLEQVYRDQGFLRATVRPVALEKHDPDRTLLTFEIDPGPRAAIGAVQVEGTPIGTREAFLKTIGVAPGAPYQPAAITAALSTYVEKLHKRGRYEAAVSYRPRPSADATVVDLTVFVQIGRAVTIAYRGDPIPREKLADLVPLAREASVDEDLVEDSVQRIKRYLNQQGYWKADTTVEREEGDGTLAIVFTIHKGAHYVVSQGVEIDGNRSVAIEQLRPALVKLQPNDVFVESNLSAAVSAIAGVYQKLGYAQAKVNASANELNPPAPGQGLVRPVIVITEGPLTLVGEVRFAGDASIPEDQLRPLITSAPGTPYYEPRIAADRDKVTLEYRNRGFESVNVVVVPALSPDQRQAGLMFEITEGQQTIVDHILIIGNTRTDQRVIKRELLIQEGKPLGLEDIAESQRRLGALGLFRRFRIEELAHGNAGNKDVLVTVEEAAARTFSYGGGAEVTKRLFTTLDGPEERLDLGPRGFVDLGFRNIGGRNRSLDLYSRLALHPEATASGSTNLAGFGFSEYRVVSTLREPRAIGLNADLALTAAIEQGIRSTFNFTRKGVNAEIGRRLSPGVRTNARYSFNTTRTFQSGPITPENEARIDRLFPQVRLSIFAGAISRDTRDDVLDPGRGSFVSEEASVAARALGGQVGFLKSYSQGFWFHRLPVQRRIVFASRVAVGLAHGFTRPVASIDGVPQPPIDDLPASERFFAGGDTTIRGFALDTAGAPNTISPTGFPLGGNALLLFNGELRMPVWRDLGAAVFLDGGNVFNRVSEIELDEARATAGFGLRYRSPIGPIRFDIGFKLDRQLVAGRLESGHAFHFSVGQAF
jgi:outer membrane protein insertion porin family